MRVDKMSREASVKLGDLVKPAMLVSDDRTSVQANDAAVALMGDNWQACAEALVECTGSGDERDGWHHRVVSLPSEECPSQFAVHTTGCADGCQLILLDMPTTSDLTPSPLLEEVLESISDCFFALDGAGSFVYVNSNAAKFFGAAREELIGQTPLSLKPFDGRFSDAYSKAMHEGTAVTYDARSSDLGSWIEIRGYPVGGGMACYFADITDRIVQQERIAFMATHDSLTGLPNREYLQDQLVRAVARGRRGQPSALLFMDMDRFKIVNDTVGHAAGDGVLVEFAAVVESCIRDVDMLARFGGDEFALLLDGTGVAEALIVGDRIHKAVREHDFRYESHSFSLGVSIGMTVVDGTLEEGRLMSLADSAMYEAKALGLEQTCCHFAPGATDATPGE